MVANVPKPKKKKTIGIVELCESSNSNNILNFKFLVLIAFRSHRPMRKVTDNEISP